MTKFSLRQRLAIKVGDLAAWASKTAGRGSGESIRGELMMKIAPNLFESLLADRQLAIVSGTNGKTTTTHLLTAALRTQVANPNDVVTNSDGANLVRGIVSAISRHPEAEIAVLETDEQVVPYTLRAGHPKVLVMLNFSRDQLDRHHEVNALGRSWRAALAELGDEGPSVIANVNDPLVVWAALAAPKQIWVDMGVGWMQDATLCPACSAILSIDGHEWQCPNCNLAKPTPHLVTEANVVRFSDGRTFELNLQVPGRFNCGNAACALAAAEEMGVAAETALPAMRQVTSPAGRFAIATFSNADGSTTKARLILAKNPAGWAESLLMLRSNPVIIAVDSAIADGTDLSWLWDVEYEKLAGRKVIVTGKRRADLAVRLAYADVEYQVVDNLADALAGPFDETIDVLAMYTPFMKLCRLGGVKMS